MLYSQKTFGVAKHVSRFLSFSFPPPHLASFFFLIACPSRSRVIRPRGKEEQREQFRFQYLFFLFFNFSFCASASLSSTRYVCVCVCRKNDTTTSEWIALNTSPRSRPLSDEALCDDNEIENPFR